MQVAFHTDAPRKEHPDVSKLPDAKQRWQDGLQGFKVVRFKVVAIVSHDAYGHGSPFWSEALEGALNNLEHSLHLKVLSRCKLAR